MAETPKISFVVTSRNDDHGGNLLHRMQVFVNALFEQCNKHKLPAELVIVEWNPPRDRPPLAEALAWPAESGFCSARIVTVPPAIHQKFEHAGALPLYQMIAKNVGIRRAAGDFVLATNIDILFNDELMDFLANQTLDENLMYRIDRWDVGGAVPLDASVDEQLEFCRRHVSRVNRKIGTYDARAGQYFGGDPMLSGISRRLQELLGRIDPGRLPPAWLHTNACGDFTLLSKEAWLGLRGYPEFDSFSLHIDSVFCQMAHNAGFHEEILGEPMRVYHMEQLTGSGWSPDGQDLLLRRIDEGGIPILSMKAYTYWSAGMRRTKTAIAFNGRTWGLANRALTEDWVAGNHGQQRTEENEGERSQAGDRTADGASHGSDRWPMREDAFGTVKRLDFLANCIQRTGARRVVDVGCGTGTSVTWPLAQAFPQVEFTGIDSDEPSLEVARASYQSPNLRFHSWDDHPTDSRYDLAILSEVLEHVEDPYALLKTCADLVTRGSHVVVTVPNGYGPFEWAALVETLLGRSVDHDVLAGVRARGDIEEGRQVSTLSLAPHLQFFSFRDIMALFDAQGWELVEYRPRTFLCGFGLTRLVGTSERIEWNARIADRLPPAFASDWMFLLKRTRLVPKANSWKPSTGLYQWIRRGLRLASAGDRARSNV